VPRISVTFGLDGLRAKGNARHQLAVALTADGVVAVGRKFHPAPGETIDPAEPWDSRERGYSRIAEVAGKRYFLAVCYDGFGIKHREFARPKVDAILDHVHHFAPGESEVLFARHGFAGAAQQWRVPLFGAAVFHGRAIPPAWPSGVRWKGAPRSTMEWKCEHNPMRPQRTLRLSVGEGRAEVRVFRWS
jgi:hypothetical protein